MFSLDLVLAILHHLIVFTLFAVVFVVFVYVRSGMDAAAVRRIAAIDAWYAYSPESSSRSDSAVLSSPPKAGTITRTTRSSEPRSAHSW